MTRLKPPLRSIVSRARARVRDLYGKASVDDRIAPGFLIVGAQKAGTSSLYHALSAHPNLALPERNKEIHYFDLKYDRGPVWYRAQFPKQATDVTLHTGEASPYYLVHPHCPGRISTEYPDMRVIMLFRNPITRAISHYHHTRRHGTDELPVLDAMMAEEERIGAEWERLVADPAYESPVYRVYSYKHRGQYAAQLRRYLEHFPAEQILCLQSEDLFESPAAVMERVSAFLEIPLHESLTGTERKNRGSYDLPDGRVVEYLSAHFEPHNQELAQLVPIDLGKWSL